MLLKDSAHIELKEIFLKLIIKYTNFPGTAQELWREIESAYNSKNRHYHTLTHLKNLIEELSQVKDKIYDWDPVLFAIFYHDIVYETQRKNNSAQEKKDPIFTVTLIGESPIVKQDIGGENEDESALIAQKRLIRLLVSEHTASLCMNHILATKFHRATGDTDSNLFTDADLSVLGKDSATYIEYAKNIRKEYLHYSNSDYKQGRNKVLSHFLEKAVFKTNFFYSKYEENARKNILAELNLSKENFDENEFKENILKIENEKNRVEQQQKNKIEQDRIQSEINKNKNDDEWVDMYNLDD